MDSDRKSNLKRRPVKTRATRRRENELIRAGYGRVAGVDEAGRGCLAGPVFAAAVILEPNKPVRGLADSKLLPKEKRDELAAIIETNALAYAVASCNPREIERLNILWASLEAMKRAINKLENRPDYVLIDGHMAIPDLDVANETVVKGDARCSCIAAASILAKVYRDNAMNEMHNEFPHYHWDTNVGYPTPEHFEALSRLGPTPHHRRTFQLRLQQSLFNDSEIDI